MKHPPATHRAAAPCLFDRLEQTAFQRLKHAASLKGLLRPFQDKGELEVWASQCEGLRDGLIVLAQQLLAQATAYPFSLLPVTLTLQSTGAGTTFLRWHNADRSAMGVSLWVKLIDHPNTPQRLLHELLALEHERILLNMQVSLTHSIARQARECVGKMAQAEAVYQRRVNSQVQSTHQEFP